MTKKILLCHYFGYPVSIEVPENIDDRELKDIQGSFESTMRKAFKMPTDKELEEEVSQFLKNI